MESVEDLMSLRGETWGAETSAQDKKIKHCKAQRHKLTYELTGDKCPNHFYLLYYCLTCGNTGYIKVNIEEIESVE